MACKDITFADLARERINILGLEVVHGTTNMFANVEYQYQPANAPRTWHKIVIPIVDDDEVLDTIFNEVKAIKAELEK